MDVVELPLHMVDVSEHNTRRQLDDDESSDSSIDDLADSIERQGLLNPITVVPRDDGRFAVIAGQRRLLAFRKLNRNTIPGIVRRDIAEGEAKALSLVENVHRQDMNPRDKAHAFASLREQLGTVQDVARATGVTTRTIRKYLALLDLAPDLQERLAAGETKSTDALAQLAGKFDPDTQLDVWDRIGGFRQDIQKDILRELDDDLDNLDDLVERAAKGDLGLHVIRDCPHDCPVIPEDLKAVVARLLAEHDGHQ